VTCCVSFVRFDVVFVLRAAEPARGGAQVVMVMRVTDQANHDWPQASARSRAVSNLATEPQRNLATEAQSPEVYGFATEAQSTQRLIRLVASRVWLKKKMPYSPGDFTNH
jgi:hypothetical protein